MDFGVQLQKGHRAAGGNPSGEQRLHRLALVRPIATSTIALASRIVAMPIDRASRGTSRSRPPNNALFAGRVPRVSAARCVRARSARAGSLKPM